MKDFAETFYKGKAWTDCRKAYIKSVSGLCEKCLKKGIYKPAVIVHHIQHITPDNIYNPEITLSYGNLMALCRDCHAEMHSKKKRYRVDQETGEVIINGDQSINYRSCV